jgi:hypothetical protein
MLCRSDLLMNKIKKPWTSAHGLYDSFEGNDDQRAADAPAA